MKTHFKNIVENKNPFGSPMIGRDFSSANYRFGFNGQEKDNEVKGGGNSYSFETRIYDSRLGIFLSIDQMVKMYPCYSPFIFAADIPIRYVDLFGWGPGDKFKTITLAAKDFGKTFNDNSIRERQEYGSTIYKVVKAGEVYYSYSIPAKGGNDAVICSNEPKGTEQVADIHSHGCYERGYGNNKFSPEDKSGDDQLRIKGYLTTPNGSLKEYDPTTKLVSTISVDMPSDPKDPDRKNTIDPIETPVTQPNPSQSTTPATNPKPSPSPSNNSTTNNSPSSNGSHTNNQGSNNNKPTSTPQKPSSPSSTSTKPSSNGNSSGNSQKNNNTNQTHSSSSNTHSSAPSNNRTGRCERRDSF